jgi:hypothetical protein
MYMYYVYMTLSIYTRVFRCLHTYGDTRGPDPRGRFLKWVEVKLCVQSQSGLSRVVQLLKHLTLTSMPVVVEAEGRRFKSRGLLVFLGIFLIRNSPAGHHQLRQKILWRMEVCISGKRSYTWWNYVHIRGKRSYGGWNYVLEAKDLMEDGTMYYGKRSYGGWNNVLCINKSHL